MKRNYTKSSPLKNINNMSWIGFWICLSFVSLPRYSKRSIESKSSHVQSLSLSLCVCFYWSVASKLSFVVCINDTLGTYICTLAHTIEGKENKKVWRQFQMCWFLVTEKSIADEINTTNKRIKNGITCKRDKKRSKYRVWSERAWLPKCHRGLSRKRRRKQKTFPFSYPTERKCVAAQGGKRTKWKTKKNINTKIKSSRRFFFGRRVGRNFIRGWLLHYNGTLDSRNINIYK